LSGYGLCPDDVALGKHLVERLRAATEQTNSLPMYRRTRNRA
jgi:hypothetical protein